MRCVSVHSSIKHEEVCERAYQSTRFSLAWPLDYWWALAGGDTMAALTCMQQFSRRQLSLSAADQSSCMGSESFRGMLDGGSRKGVSESQDRRGDSWKWSDNGSLPPVLMVMAINVDSQSHECKVCREFLCRYLIVNAVGQPIVEGIE